MLALTMRPYPKSPATAAVARRADAFDPVDRDRAELNEERELHDWTERFDGSANQLLDALARVGVSARAVVRGVARAVATAHRERCAGQWLAR